MGYFLCDGYSLLKMWWEKMSRLVWCLSHMCHNLTMRLTEWLRHKDMLAPLVSFMLLCTLVHTYVHSEIENAKLEVYCLSTLIFANVSVHSVVGLVAILEGLYGEWHKVCDWRRVQLLDGFAIEKMISSTIWLFSFSYPTKKHVSKMPFPSDNLSSHGISVDYM